MLTKIEHKFKNYFKQVTYKEVRAIEKKTYKYIIRSYEPFIEEKAKTFIQEVSAIKKMKVSGIKHYEVIRIPFRERHPNFQIYFSTIVLVIIWLKR
jgi:hypothetical protein